MRNSVAARTSRSVCSSVSVSLPGDSWEPQGSGAVCESRGGRPGFPVPTSPCGPVGQSSGAVEVAVLGSPSLIVFMVSADVKQH